MCLCRMFVCWFVYFYRLSFLQIWILRQRQHQQFVCQITLIAANVAVALVLIVNSTHTQRKQTQA